MARIGAAASPPVDPPRALKPFVRFGRLPDHALAAVRRALDDDDEFRTRVAALADEAELGRPAWLFVARPDDWDSELSQLADEARARADAERDEREERSARRRLSRAEEATERAQTAAAEARAEAAKATTELAAERRERRAAQDDAAKLARRATSLEGERDSARRQAAEATAEAERLRAEAHTLRTELEGLREELRAVRTELDTAAAHAAERVEVASPPEPGVPAVPVDAVALGRAISAAAAAAESLSRALSEASVALGTGATEVGGGRPRPPDETPATTVTAPTAPTGTASTGDQLRSAGARVTGPIRRHPPVLPPAVFDDTVEAANHLVRMPDVLVLVDGYNVAKALWPDVAPIELRERLVDALSELEARTAAGIHVVFDGADLGGPPPRLPVRRGVRVSFSPPDVEADDVILDLVEATSAERPVVVASSDRRVQDGARARGAGVISGSRLAAVLGRA